MNKPSLLQQEIVRQGRIQADVALEAGISESRMSRIVNRRVTTFSYAYSRLVDLEIVPHSSEFVIPANLLYPPVLATRPVAQIRPICPLRPLSSGERARLLGTDLPPPTA
jgi:hypothetical protein